MSKTKQKQKNNLIWDYDKGEIVDGDTGIVVGAITDTGPEWRAFNPEQVKKKERTGAPLTYTRHDKGLTTKISEFNRDGYGNVIKGQQKYRAQRLRRADRKSKARGREISLSIGLSEVEKISNELGLPKSVIETASVIYRKAHKKSLTRGRSIGELAAASVKLGSRLCGQERNVGDISKASKIKKPKIWRSFKYICRELENYSFSSKPSIDKDNIKFIDTVMGRLNAEEKIEKRLDEIEENFKKKKIEYEDNRRTAYNSFEKTAYKILNAAKEAKLTESKKGQGIVASVLFIDSILHNRPFTQKDLSEAAGVTEVTIRNRYKMLNGENKRKNKEKGLEFIVYI